MAQTVMLATPQQHIKVGGVFLSVFFFTQAIVGITFYKILQRILWLIQNVFSLTRGDNLCSRVGFVLCRLISIQLYGLILIRHVY